MTQEEQKIINNYINEIMHKKIATKLVEEFTLTNILSKETLYLITQSIYQESKDNLEKVKEISNSKTIASSLNAASLFLSLNKNSIYPQLSAKELIKKILKENYTNYKDLLNGVDITINNLEINNVVNLISQRNITKNYQENSLKILKSLIKKEKQFTNLKEIIEKDQKQLIKLKNNYITNK